VVKYRKQLLTGEKGRFVKGSTLSISECSDFTVEKTFGLTDILSVQSATLLLIQFENTFKSKDNLTIHPRYFL
jgi:hypothetical protein